MKFNVGLYPVISEEFCNNRSMTDVLKLVIEGGAKIVQLRQKHANKKDLYNLALQYREITYKAGVLLIINDHIDIALSVKADGVHLGQDDLPLSAARKIAPKLIIGISTHNTDEIDEAQKRKASYINIGPVFSTSTKELKVLPLGIDYLKEAVKKVKIPFTVMGGINKDNIIKVLECGANNVAMVTAVTRAEDIVKTTRDFIEIINKYKRV